MPLQFESRFESGNLLRAIHVGVREYDLVLQLDPREALAIEDSSAGLTAALGAGLPCVVSLSQYTTLEPVGRFAGAGAVVDQLGEGAQVLLGPPCQDGRITLSYLELLR